MNDLSRLVGFLEGRPSMGAQEAPETTLAPKKRILTKGQMSGAKVVVIFVSGVAINKLSEIVEISAPVIVVGALVVILAMLIIESMGTQGAVDEQLQENLDLVKFSLASLILGGIMGAIWIVPLFEYRSISIFQGWGFAPFDTYELGAAVCISLLAALAAFRKQKLIHVSAFIMASVTGMSMVLSLKSEKHGFLITFVGWTGLAAIAVALAYLAPDVIRLFRRFWGSAARD